MMTYDPKTTEHPEGYSCSTRTPWGAAQVAYKYAPGVIYYSCAGHGGFHLSKTRNTVVHPAWRNDDGWYEEDCEYAIAVLTWPDLFHASMVESAESAAKSWFPHEYEKVTGVKVDPSESNKLREEIFDAEHADDWVVVSASGDWADWVPAGKVGVTAAKGGGRTSASWATARTFLVDADRYESRTGRYVIDLAADTEYTEAAA